MMITASKIDKKNEKSKKSGKMRELTALCNEIVIEKCTTLIRLFALL